MAGKYLLNESGSWTRLPASRSRRRFIQIYTWLQRNQHRHGILYGFQQIKPWFYCRAPDQCCRTRAHGFAYAIVVLEREKYNVWSSEWVGSCEETGFIVWASYLHVTVVLKSNCWIRGNCKEAQSTPPSIISGLNILMLSRDKFKLIWNQKLLESGSTVLYVWISIFNYSKNHPLSRLQCSCKCQFKRMVHLVNYQSLISAMITCEHDCSGILATIHILEVKSWDASVFNAKRPVIMILSALLRLSLAKVSLLIYSVRPCASTRSAGLL